MYKFPSTQTKEMFELVLFFLYSRIAWLVVVSETVWPAETVACYSDSGVQPLPQFHTSLPGLKQREYNHKFLSAEKQMEDPSLSFMLSEKENVKRNIRGNPFFNHMFLWIILMKFCYTSLKHRNDKDRQEWLQDQSYLFAFSWILLVILCILDRASLW